MELLLPILIIAAIIYAVMNSAMVIKQRKQPRFKGWTTDSLFSLKSIAVSTVYCLVVSAVMVVTYAVIPLPPWIVVPIALLVGVVTMGIVGKVVARSTHLTCPLPPQKNN
ncbi:MAG: hypothetical protein ABIR91_02365 [Candidatus Saccharimonadales bacterium]